MELRQHPEYQTYMCDREADQRCRQAIAFWKASDEPIVAETYSSCWTFDGAQTFVRSLSRLFQAYNRVLWERFPYCRTCGGQCCVLDATYVGPFDSMALALLGQSMPRLPGRIKATARDCIYHTVGGCAWPAEWRPIKCWSFYCALGERSSIIAQELEGVVLGLLPDALRRCEAVRGDPLVAHLGDPVDFARAFGCALFHVFVAPFDDRYPAMDKKSLCDYLQNLGTQESASSDVTSDLLAFITEAAERACESSPPAPKEIEVSSDQLLADLELLEWIVVGQPEQAAKLLEDMYLRYARAPAPKKGDRATIWYRMRNHLLALRKEWSKRSALTSPKAPTARQYVPGNHS